MVETLATIKLSAKLGYKPIEMYYLLRRGWGAFEMKKKILSLSGTRGLSKDKRAFNIALGSNAGK